MGANTVPVAGAPFVGAGVDLPSTMSYALRHLSVSLCAAYSLSAYMVRAVARLSSTESSSALACTLSKFTSSMTAQAKPHMELTSVSIRTNDQAYWTVAIVQSSAVADTHTPAVNTSIQNTLRLKLMFNMLPILPGLFLVCNFVVVLWAIAM